MILNGSTGVGVVDPRPEVGKLDQSRGPRSSYNDDDNNSDKTLFIVVVSVTMGGCRGARSYRPSGGTRSSTVGPTKWI